jgi:ABC-2 type transport system permease protein
MLAIEGQIYESDVGNPTTALIGNFDFTFLAVFVFPLVLIVVLHDIRSREKTEGRFNLVESTVINRRVFWLSRVFVRGLLVFSSLMFPLWAGAWIAEPDSNQEVEMGNIEEALSI